MNKTTKGYLKYKSVLCFLIGVIVIITDLSLISQMLIEENYDDIGDLVAYVITFSIPFLLLGIYLIYRGNIYRIAITNDTKVTVTISKIETEDCYDSDGRHWLEHCVYVDYEYNGEKYENIYWYGAETKNKSHYRLQKELEQFPKKGETFQIYINHNNPSEILSKAPFRIVN